MGRTVGSQLQPAMEYLSSPTGPLSSSRPSPAELHGCAGRAARPPRQRRCAPPLSNRQTERPRSWEHPALSVTALCPSRHDPSRSVLNFNHLTWLVQCSRRQITTDCAHAKHCRPRERRRFSLSSRERDQTTSRLGKLPSIRYLHLPTLPTLPTDPSLLVLLEDAGKRREGKSSSDRRDDPSTHSLSHHEPQVSCPSVRRAHRDFQLWSGSQHAARPAVAALQRCLPH